MPIFEYDCPACGKTFETLQRSGARAPACPACGARKTRRKLSVFSATVARPGAPACASGACSAGGGCASGQCPFGPS